ASVNRGDSRQAATANRRSGVSPASVALFDPASTQALHPLIWLALRCTSASVEAGTPPFSALACSAWTACQAPGITAAGFLIRGCRVAIAVSIVISFTDLA